MTFQAVLNKCVHFDASSFSILQFGLKVCSEWLFLLSLVPTSPKAVTTPPAVAEGIFHCALPRHLSL